MSCLLCTHSVKPTLHGSAALLIWLTWNGLVLTISIRKPVSIRHPDHIYYRDYADHWQNLLLDEFREEERTLKQQRKKWSISQLEENGVSIVGAKATPAGEVLGEKIASIYKNSKRSFNSLFKRGDHLLVTPAVKDAIAQDCVVIDVEKDRMTIGVGETWPKGMTKAGVLVRLDREVARGPLEAQTKALKVLSEGSAGEAANLLAALFYSSRTLKHLASEFPTRNVGEIEDIRKALQMAKNVTPFTPNPSQEEAIVKALARRVSMIRGPPGTGKTKTAASLIATAVQLNHCLREDSDQVDIVRKARRSSTRVLAVTHSNGAADVLLEALVQMKVPAVRLGHAASVAQGVQHRTLAAVAEKMSAGTPRGFELRQIAANCTLDNQARSSATIELRENIKSCKDMILAVAPVIVTTCIGAWQLVDGNSAGHTFHLVILDEAAQSSEPAFMCALVAAKAEQIVLVGDTRQLPPTVLSQRPRIRNSLSKSPMARLEKNGIDEFMLKVQYRMPESLIAFSSIYFYGGLVKSADDRPIIPPPLGFPWRHSQHFAFVKVAGDEVTDNSGGISNPKEAKLVVNVLSNLLEAGEVTDANMVVISPYSNQVKLIRSELLYSKGPSTLRNISVGTVDSFQGQEVDIVVFSAVRSNPSKDIGFLRDSRRLNVAITRAKRGLILIGDDQTLCSCKHWNALLSFYEQRGCILNKEDIQRSSAALRKTREERLVSSVFGETREEMLASFLAMLDEL